ncbi:MAG: diguanylate cyclase, partial [Lachnospiraceae bacterium]|nr:diguanylate cyclase [Lachnospiraceae bacterium]
GKLQNISMENTDGLKSNNIRCIESWKNGYIIGTDEGAYLLEQDGKCEEIAPGTNLNGQRILSIEVSGDIIYIGTNDDGFYVIEQGEMIDHQTQKNGLQSDTIMKMTKDPKSDGVWVVTGSNIAYYQNQKVNNIGHFPCSNNFDLICQEDGVIWILSGNGIYRTTKESMLSHEDLDYYFMAAEDGLLYDITANSWSAVKDNQIYICESEGVLKLDMDQYRIETDGIILGVEQMLADGEQVKMGGQTDSQNENQADEDENVMAVLDSNVKRIDIEACVLNYTLDNPDVYYQLEGFDEGEYTVNSKAVHSIVYTNLPGGVYKLHIGLKDKESGEKLDQEAVFTIKKAYRWYENPRAMLLLTLGILSAGVLFSLLGVNYREKKMKRQMKEEYEQREKETLKILAYRDKLTGMYNQNAYHKKIDQLVEEKAKDFSMLEVALCNIDYINSNQGFAYGDYLVHKIVSVIGKYKTEKIDIYNIANVRIVLLSDQKASFSHMAVRLKKEFAEYLAAEPIRPFLAVGTARFEKERDLDIRDTMTRCGMLVQTDRQNQEKEFMEITQKMKEEQQRTNETILNICCGVLVYYVGKQGKTLYTVNQEFLKLLGVTKEEFYQKEFPNETYIYHEDIRMIQEQEAFLMRDIEQGVSSQREWIFRCQNQKTKACRWLLAKGKSICKENQTGYIYISYVDITEQKLIEEELRVSEARLRMSNAISGIMVFSYGTNDKEKISVENSMNVLGYPEEEFCSFIEHALKNNKKELDKVYEKIIKEEDIPIVKKSDEILWVKGDSQCEMRVKSKENGYIWCQYTRKVVYDEEAQPLRMIGTLCNVDDLHKERQRLKIMAEYDSLTGALNRASAIRIMEEILRKKVMQRHALCVIDIDDFKSANDTYGHAFGDQVIIRAVEEIRKVVRIDDIIGRYGGDEFMVLIENVEQMEDVKKKGEQLCDIIAQMKVEPSHPYQCTCSVGIAVSQGKTDFVELFKKADAALYQAKKAGKSRSFIG